MVEFIDPTARKKQKRDDISAFKNVEFDMKQAGRDVARVGQQALDKKSKKSIENTYIESLNGKVI